MGFRIKKGKLFYRTKAGCTKKDLVGNVDFEKIHYKTIDSLKRKKI